MPRSEVARRERDKLVRVWVWGVLGAILVALLIIAAAFCAQVRRRPAARRGAGADERAACSRSVALGGQSGARDRVRAHRLPQRRWPPTSRGRPCSPRSPASCPPTRPSPASTSPSAARRRATTRRSSRARRHDHARQPDAARHRRDHPVAARRRGRAVRRRPVRHVEPGRRGRYAYLLNVEFDQTIYSGAVRRDRRRSETDAQAAHHRSSASSSRSASSPSASSSSRCRSISSRSRVDAQTATVANTNAIYQAQVDSLRAEEENLDEINATVAALRAQIPADRPARRRLRGRRTRGRGIRASIVTQSPRASRSHSSTRTGADGDGDAPQPPAPEATPAPDATARPTADATHGRAPVAAHAPLQAASRSTSRSA